jgi:hypothetical protein
MQFAIVNVTTLTVGVIECDDLIAAQIAAGLKLVDHGVVAPGLGIVVDEFGLYTPPDKQSYFAIFRRLYAGNGVLYGFNRHGESVDLIAIPPVVFMPSARAVERNIEIGAVQRPQTTINGEVIWQWPDDRR